MTTSKREVYAVLMALVGDTLLVPNIAVAEVLSYDRLKPEGGPDWFAGRCDYNNRRLPVARFEVMNGAAAAENTRRTRIAVVNCVGSQLASQHYGLVCQGYPHLVTLNRAALLKELLSPNDREDLVLTRVKIANTAAAIPNLQTLETELARLDAAS